MIHERGSACEDLRRSAGSTKKTTLVLQQAEGSTLSSRSAARTLNSSEVPQLKVL